jgi:glycosyltransferase involved in cell wall biosynthesis
LAFQSRNKFFIVGSPEQRSDRRVLMPEGLLPLLYARHQQAGDDLSPDNDLTNWKRVMRIAQLAPLAEAVPPKLYGGTERVVSWLTEELVDIGHEVTLFASGDSITNAVLEPCSPQALRLDPTHRDPMLAYGVALAQIAHQASQFDVVHSHIDWVHIPLLRRLGVPFVTTLHGRLDLPDLSGSFENCFVDAPFVSISNAQRAPLPQAHWVATVYHGLPKNLLKPNFAPEGYLAFLGRIAPEKGPETAIRLARAAGIPLKIAAKVDKVDQAYFENKVRPLIDGKDIEFVGEIDEPQKAAFLGNAAALLFPICWPEPFGLVVIEAMACGTPVIAFRCGSVPELIEDGVTGFVVDSYRDSLSAVDCVAVINRRTVRASFERRFTARRMAEDYIRVYESISDQCRPDIAKIHPGRKLQPHRAPILPRKPVPLHPYGRPLELGDPAA